MDRRDSEKSARKSSISSRNGLSGSRAPYGNVLAAAAAVVWIRGGVGRDLFGRQYEYEEDLTIGIDGSGTLTINASLAALNALRGLDVDPLASSVDRERIRALYQSNVARVRSVPRPWSRHGRQFVQINLEFDDVRRLSEDAPLSWSRYELTDRNGQHLFRQAVGAAALKPGTLKNVGWDGSELVAFRLHLPSRILEHNARDLETNEPTGIHRGNDRGAHGQRVDSLSHAVPVRGRLQRRRADAGAPDLVDYQTGQGVSEIN